MKQRPENFLKSLYDEKLKHKEYRNTFVVQKLLFTIGLFGLGATSVSNSNINLGFLLYFVPFVALAYDVYIFAEDYKVKRVGIFVQHGCSAKCEDEKLWEEWVADNREPLAAFASLILTLIALGASATIIYARAMDDGFFTLWLVVAMAITTGVFGYALKLRNKLERAASKLAKKVSSMRVLLPGERLTAIRAHQQDQLTISWGPGPKDVAQQRGFAKRQGWPTPTFGFKKAFIAKMLESDETFELAVLSSGIDVYAPD